MRKLNPIALAVSVCLATSGQSVLAAEASQDNQKIIITGSHIKRIENESSSPLTIINREDIDRSGATTLSGLLETTVLNNGGALNNQQTSGFTPGAASYNLRGLRSDRTLVLIDGRRLASYPFGQNGSVAFVDLNTIPLAEVESVEILKDGASAVYGSDAIAGVVNVITKRTFIGNELKVNTVQTDSNYQSNSVSLLSGFSDNDNDLVFVAEFQKYDSLLGGDIDEASSLNLSETSLFSSPGTFITLDGMGNLISTPAGECARVEDAADIFVSVTGDFCVNDWAAQRQLIPENERMSLSLKWSRYFGENSLYTGLSLSQIDTTSDVPFGFLGSDFFISATNPFNPLGENMLFYRGFNEIGLQSIETEAKNTNFVVGFEGLINEMDFDIKLSHSLTNVDEVYADGWILRDDAINFFDAIENEQVNPFQPLTNAQIADLTSSFNHKGKSYQTALAAKLSGELTEVEAGAVLFATGIEFRKEFIRDTSDAAIINGDVVGLGSSAAEGDREVTALFGEFIIPASDTVEFNLALRYDDYSDFGSSVNPKASLSYKPSESTLIRASYGTGFRAPNLFELYTDEVSGSVGSVPFIQQANAELDAETSESFNIGFVFDVDERLMASFDFWQIEVEDMITNLGVNTILTAVDENDELIYGDLIILNPDDTIDFVIDPFLNLESQTAQGMDFTARFGFTDNLELKVNVSHLNKLERVNAALGETIDFEGEYLFPKNRFSTVLTWKKGDVTHYLSSYYVEAHGDENFALGTYSKVDYQLNYEHGDHRLSFMLGNLLDEEAPTNRLGAWPYYDQRMYSPLGRTTSLTWTYNF
ncbi:TonB-dependent receptor [Aliikangiella marina]|uniref:TonB-dependent receptor n=1 Tax=Aliikangiella marina TaxID=1712262 RepID=A0A545TJ39_9GAMM|nr:TonB-dependent receptor [Aliikangiella marina]TQV77235.1 TonB-dependent receptor [Aliikangiella marina]